MPEKRLREELSHLHSELEQASSVDRASRELLEELMTDIRRLLDTPPATSRDDEDDDGLAERLGDAVRHFEEEHPNLAVAVGRIATALSNIGI
jgi:hypothetical protein